jgi:hypothetical protein
MGDAQGESRTEWVAMRKGVPHLFRYREVSMMANMRTQISVIPAAPQ